MDVWAMKQDTETGWTQSWDGEQIVGRPWEPGVGDKDTPSLTCSLHLFCGKEQLGRGICAN